MDINNLMRFIQVGVGVLMIIIAVFQPQFLYRRFHLGSHRVDRLLFLIGGVILTLLGLFGNLPRIGR